MNIKEKKSLLIKRQTHLYDEVLDIQKELVVLIALLRRAEQEVNEIQIKLDKSEMLDTINFAYAS